MKKNTYFAFIALFVLGLFALSACSKDDVSEPLSGNASFTMKVEGESWHASITSMLTDEMSDGEQGDFRHVFLGGSREAGKDNIETIQMFVAIPSDKFRNPKGTYPISLRTETVNFATALFSRGSTAYVSRDPDDQEKSVGVLEIKDFEIGQQYVAGQPTGTEGYTRLSGTFHVALMSTDDPDGPMLKITDGKFDLSEGLNVED